MRQALLIFKKDLRCLWPELIVLYAVLTVHTAYALRDSLEREEINQALNLPFVFLLTVLIVIGRLVQQDSLLGTRAFWQTRPIHPGSLLMAKVLSLACLLAAAFLSACAVLLTFGLSPDQFLTGLLDALLPQLNLITVSVLLAAVTPNLPTYVAAWLGMQIAMLLTQDLGNFVARIPRVTDYTREFVWQVSVLFPGLLLVAHQYWTRRTRWTLAGSIIAFFGVVFTPSLWPWELGEVFLPNVSREVQARLRGAAPDGAFLALRESGGEMLIRAAPEILRPLPGSDFTVGMAGELQVDASTRASLSGPSVRIDAGGILDALPGFHWAGGRSTTAPPLQMETAGPAAFDDLVEKPGSLRGEIHGRVYGYRLAGAVRVEAGVRLDKGWATALVRSVSREGPQVKVVLRSRQIQVGRQDREFPRVVLANSARKEVVAGTSQTRSSSTYSGGLVSAFRRVAQDRVLLFPAEENEGGLLLDDRWLAEAELVFLEPVQKGWFETKIHISDFRTRDITFDPKARSAWVN